MIDLPRAPFESDYIGDLHDAINYYVHRQYYKNDKQKYELYNTKLDEAMRMKEYQDKKRHLLNLRKELLSVATTA